LLRDAAAIGVLRLAIVPLTNGIVAPLPAIPSMLTGAVFLSHRAGSFPGAPARRAGVRGDRLPRPGPDGRRAARPGRRRPAPPDPRPPRGAGAGAGRL